MQRDRSRFRALDGASERTFATRGGLVIEATTDPQSATLEEFYSGYDAAFVLPNEKEELDGFVACLALNAGADYARLAERYGPFREVVLVARDGASGEIVGGANFIAFPLHANPDVLSINLNYIFVSPAQRRRGHFQRLFAGVGETAATFFETPTAALEQFVFIEQNDPLQMSAVDYVRDTAHSGIDQMQRIRLWAALGAKIIDFAYVQPALSAEQVPDATLIYAVLGAQGETLDACLLREHLLRFFGISVLKGADPLVDPVAARQLAELGERCRTRASVPLLTATPLADRGDEMPGRTSLRDLIRTPA